MSDNNRASAFERSRSPLQHSGISDRSESDSGAEEHLHDFIKTFGNIKSDQNNITREDPHETQQTGDAEQPAAAIDQQTTVPTKLATDDERRDTRTVTSDTSSKVSHTVDNDVLTDSARSLPAGIYIETPAHLDLQSYIRTPIDTQNNSDDNEEIINTYPADRLIEVEAEINKPGDEIGNFNDCLASPNSVARSTHRESGTSSPNWDFWLNGSLRYLTPITVNNYGAQQVDTPQADINVDDEQTHCKDGVEQPTDKQSDAKRLLLEQIRQFRFLTSKHRPTEKADATDTHIDREHNITVWPLLQPTRVEYDTNTYIPRQYFNTTHTETIAPPTTRFVREEETNTNRRVHISESTDLKQTVTTVNKPGPAQRILSTHSPLIPHATKRPTTEYTTRRQNANSDIKLSATDMAFSSSSPDRSRHIPVISDGLIGPTPFSGTSAEDSESFIKHTELYFKYKGLSENEKLTIFPLLLKSSAFDWYSTLPADEKETFDDIIDAFKIAYFPSPELKWRNAADMFQIKQHATETVVDFVSRIRKHAGKIELSDQLINAAFINGLRTPLRTHVIQQGVSELEASIRAAKIAEVAGVNTDSEMSAILLETLKNNAKMQSEQMTQIKSLTEKVAELSTGQTKHMAAAAAGITRTATDERQTYNSVERGDGEPRQNYTRRFDNRRDDSDHPRSYRLTPQRTQMENHDRLQHNRFTPQQAENARQHTPNGIQCTNCGGVHTSPAQCRARNLHCFTCQKLGHLSAYCRSGRPAPRNY